MSVRRRKRKKSGDRFEVYVSGRRVRLTSVLNMDHALAINSVAEHIQCIEGSGFPASAQSIEMLQMLSQEAYETLKGLYPKLNLETAEDRESKDHEEFLQGLQRQAERKERERFDKELDKFTKIRSAPVPETRTVPYPAVPAGTIPVTKYAEGIPDSPGVYFVWRGDQCEYVGQSIRLSNRAKLGHERIVPADTLSFLTFTKSELIFAEAYYIGVMRPQRNYRGQRRFHAPE